MPEDIEQEQPVDWITLAIEREATPKVLRVGTTEEFCDRHQLNSKKYYYQMSKKENQERIVEMSLNLAKKHTPEVLENLGTRAHEDNKAAELFLEYVLKLSKQLDIKSDGKPIPIISLPYVPANNSNQQDSTDGETN